MKIEYIKDNQVSTRWDKKIRKLLRICFTSDKESIFEQQRYYLEKPSHRYLLIDQHNELIAHVAVHDKHVYIENNPVAISGIAEVCVHPLYRKKGYVRQLLTKVHRDIEDRDVSYSVLFGDRFIYQSSGYKEVNNLFVKNITLVDHCWQPESAMVKEISRPWPTTFPVKLAGITF